MLHFLIFVSTYIYPSSLPTQTKYFLLAMVTYHSAPNHLENVPCQDHLLFGSHGNFNKNKIANKTLPYLISRKKKKKNINKFNVNKMKVTKGFVHTFINYESIPNQHKNNSK
jgi:hypothetical protein